MCIIPEAQSNFRNFIVPFAFSNISLYIYAHFGLALYLAPFHIQADICRLTFRLFTFIRLGTKKYSFSIL